MVFPFVSASAIFLRADITSRWNVGAKHPSFRQSDLKDPVFMRSQQKCTGAGDQYLKHLRSRYLADKGQLLVDYLRHIPEWKPKSDSDLFHILIFGFDSDNTAI